MRPCYFFRANSLQKSEAQPCFFQKQLSVLQPAFRNVLITSRTGLLSSFYTISGLGMRPPPGFLMFPGITWGLCWGEQRSHWLGFSASQEEASPWCLVWRESHRNHLQHYAGGIASYSTLVWTLFGVSLVLCTSKEQLCEDTQALCNRVLVLSLLHRGLLAWWGRCEPWSECAHDLPVLVTRHLVAFWIWSGNKENFIWGKRREKQVSMATWGWGAPNLGLLWWRGDCSSLREGTWAWLVWVDISKPPSVSLPSTRFLHNFSSIEEGLPWCSCAGSREVWLASFNAEYWCLGCFPHLSCVFCLRLDPWGSVLPRGESHSSLGVFCTANLSSARGEWKDVAFLCVTEEQEVALDVAVMFL